MEIINHKHEDCFDSPGTDFLKPDPNSDVCSGNMAKGKGKGKAGKAKAQNGDIAQGHIGFLRVRGSYGALFCSLLVGVACKFLLGLLGHWPFSLFAVGFRSSA